MAVYISLEYANEKILPDPNVGSRWGALTDVQKTLWLEHVTNLIDNIDWFGEKTDVAQDNQFPRTFQHAISHIDDHHSDCYSQYPHYHRRFYKRWHDIRPDVREKIRIADGIIPDEIHIACYLMIVDLLRTGKFDVMVAMQEVNITAFNASGTSFNFGDKSNPYPLPKKAWEQVYWLSMLYWTMPTIKEVGRI